MLQLERVENNRKISIRMRHKERFFNRIFLTALGVATALHLLPLTFFTVTPFRLGYTHRDLLPATVSIDTGGSDALVKTSLQEADPSIKHLGLLPLTEFPSTKPYLPLLVKPEIQLTKDSLLSDDSYEGIANTLPLSIHLPVTYPELSIQISGPLAEKELILDDTLKKAMEPRLVDLDKMIQHKVVYHVRYEGEQGTLFWFDPLQLSLNKQINASAEQLLTSLRFQHDAEKLLLPGEIEIIFTHK